MQEAFTPLAFTRHDQLFRALLIDDQAWFLVTDLAALLGYRRNAERITKHLAEDQQRCEWLVTPNGIKAHVLIDESGLYAALLRSNCPENKSLRRWIAQRMLPELRNSARDADAAPRFGSMLWKASDIQVIHWQGKLWVALEDMPQVVRNEALHTRPAS